MLAVYVVVNIIFLFTVKVLAKLEMFKASVLGRPLVSSAKAGDGGDDLSDWKSVKLKFASEPGKVSFIFLMFMAVC